MLTLDASSEARKAAMTPLWSGRMLPTPCRFVEA